MARLSEAIVTGEFVPGEKLKAPELAERWSLSPTPVREALQRLAGIGFVEMTPQRGARVAPLVEQDMRELYSLRLLLEPLALRESLRHRDEDAWAGRLDQAFAALRAHLEAGAHDVVAFESAHGEFHEALLAGCESTWLMRIVRMLGSHSVRYRLLSLGPRGGSQEVLAEHQGLYDVCTSGDVDDAVGRLFAHIRLTVESITDAEHADEVVALIDAAGQHLHAELLGGGA
jgi:GntR family carbon starvation induced transcriptional regulator